MNARRVLAGFVVLILAATAAGLPGVASAGSIEGKTFLIKGGETGAKMDQDDMLTFIDGKFHSTGCDPYGFGDGMYTVGGDGNATTFDAETLSEKEGRMKWHGVVAGDSIEGTFTWYKKPKWYRIFGKDTVEYSYTGKLKAP